MNPSAEFPAPEGATLVDCTLERHADQILAIFNDAIATSTALYDYKPRPRESMDTWFQTKQKGGFPVIGFENAAGELMGFASYGTFRARPRTSIRWSTRSMWTAAIADWDWARR